MVSLSRTNRPFLAPSSGKFEFPKRPLAAYLKFSQEIRSQLPKTTSITETTKLMTQKWKELPDEKRQVRPPPLFNLRLGLELQNVTDY